MISIHRVFIILLVVGASLGFATCLRGIESYGYVSSHSFMIEGVPVVKIIESYWLPPRSLRIAISVTGGNVTISLYFVDRVDGVKYAILYDENVVGGAYHVQIPSRGLYMLVLEGVAERVRLAVTLYGLEKDLAYASIGLMAVGAAMALIRYVAAKLRYRR